MSLEGNLTDLGLGEILQIVNLSRKTGVLSLSGSGVEGVIVFRQGQVVRATSTACKQNLGEVLVQKELIDPLILLKAILFQQENAFAERLGVILVKNFGISPDVIEEVVCEQIENAVFSLFALTEGNFKFDVQNNIETVDGIRMDPMQFMLDQGLNPQFLAMEGTRILDEKMHAAATEPAANVPPAEDDDFAFDLATESSPVISSTTTVIQQIVIVDDDTQTLRALSDGLTEKGFAVHAMTRSEDALIKVDALHRSGDNPTVLIDLIMPKMDGSGVLGGIELLELLHNNFKDIRLIVMTDFNHADAEKKVREMGYPYIFKPRRVEINTPDILQNFLSLLLQNIPT
jgi:CheY-like chemotaxis protein